MTAFSRIVTHPGSSHRDEFLACCVLLAFHAVPIFRREPSEEDLADPTTAVLDVGGRHEPDLGNFDHHQFPADHPPVCSLSLVLQYFGLYDDARTFCEWLEPAEWFDTRGPVETARFLGVPREQLPKLASPADVTLQRRFASAQQLSPGEPLWEIMRWIGCDLVGYLKSMRAKLDLVATHGEFWEIPAPSPTDAPLMALFLPRLNSAIDDPSSAMVRFVENHANSEKVIGLVYPDRRGNGFGLTRHRDDLRLDFTRVADCPDVHFAHSRGFVAKTSANNPERLLELLQLARV
jgi:hypothetical protein